MPKTHPPPRRRVPSPGIEASATAGTTMAIILKFEDLRCQKVSSSRGAPRGAGNTGPDGSRVPTDAPACPANPVSHGPKILLAPSISPIGAAPATASPTSAQSSATTASEPLRPKAHDGWGVGPHAGNRSHSPLQAVTAGETAPHSLAQGVLREHPGRWAGLPVPAAPLSCGENRTGTESVTSGDSRRDGTFLPLVATAAACGAALGFWHGMAVVGPLAPLAAAVWLAGIAAVGCASGEAGRPSTHRPNWRP